MSHIKNLKFGDKIKVGDDIGFFISFEEKTREVYFLPCGEYLIKSADPHDVLLYSKYIRESFERTQDAFAKILKVSRGTVAQWETGKNRPTGKNMAKLDKLYDYISKKGV